MRPASAGASDTSDDQGNEDKITEIVVTAQKKSERLQDVPVPVSVLAADTLVTNNQLGLEDYYSSVPGLNYASGQWGQPRSHSRYHHKPLYKSNSRRSGR